MSGRSLQVRTVVAAGLAILLALVAVGTSVDLLVGRHLHRSLDAALRERAVEIAQLSASAPALLTTPGALDSSLGGTQVSVEVVDRRRRILARSLGLGGRVLPAGRLLGAAIASGRAAYADERLGSERLRIYVAPLAEVGGPAAGGAVAVAASTHELADTLANLRHLTALAGLAAALLAATAVAFLMRHALLPLGRLATAASEIERTGDARRRLPQPPADDEVGRLASTLNGMLASLERARESERRFLADASHELRTPLTALRGNIAYLARHGPTPELVADLEHDSDRLSRLSDNLLALSREEAAAMPGEEVHLDELARTSGSTDPSLDVVAPEPVPVRGDRLALERALANLVENAHKHGPQGGRVTVRAERGDGFARLSVSDDGPGLRRAQAARAFERFWRGEHSKPGSGLGLAIVRATAERHGGRAYAEGSRFTIELPTLRDLSKSPATTEAERSRKGTP